MPARAGARRAVVAALAVLARAGYGGFVYDPEQRIESARLFGNMNKYAYYFTDVMVGQPVSQRTSVIIDTGSRLVGFPCSNCAHCGDHLDPAFDVASSGTATWFNCSVSCPEACLDDRCPYRESYAEGSTVSGYWFEDFLELGDPANLNPPVRVRLGCHTNENKLFYSQHANGIMGLAPSTGSPSQPTILQQMFGDRKHINTQIFSICLATWGGRIAIGGYNSSYHLGGLAEDAIQWIDMRATHYYYVEPEGLMLIDGDEANELVESASDFGATIVDSGTTYTYLPELVFLPLMARLEEYCRDHDDCGADRDDDRCWRLRDPDAGPTRFPPLAFHFGGGVHISWMPQHYLQQRGDEARWCRTFMQNTVPQTVMGISVMLQKDFIFDIGGERLGVADAQCPEYYEEPTDDDQGSRLLKTEQKFSGPRPLGNAARPRLGTSMSGISSLAVDDEVISIGVGSAALPGSASGGSRGPAALPDVTAALPPWGRAASAVGLAVATAALATVCAARVKRRYHAVMQDAESESSLNLVWSGATGQADSAGAA